jgi:hypothetical protein
MLFNTRVSLIYSDQGKPLKFLGIFSQRYSYYESSVQSIYQLKIDVDFQMTDYMDLAS